MDVTYGKFCCVYKEHKGEKKCTILTVEGDRINYPCNIRTPRADLLTIKILINIVISTKDTYLMTLYISNFYLNSPLDIYNYIRLNITNLL